MVKRPVFHFLALSGFFVLFQLANPPVVSALPDEQDSGSEQVLRRPGELKHTHEGSIGNLCTREIRERMDRVIRGFPEYQVQLALKTLSSL